MAKSVPEEMREKGTEHQDQRQDESQQRKYILEYFSRFPSIFTSLEGAQLRRIVQAASSVVALIATVSYIKLGYTKLVYFLVLHPFCSKNDSSKFAKVAEYDYQPAEGSRQITVKRSAAHGVRLKGNIHLDTVEFFSSDQEKLDPKERKYVIYCPGKSRCYEDGEQNFVAMAAEQECTVVVFNYPGVRNSGGSVSSFNTLVDSVVAQVDYLENQDINLAQQVVIEGYCMGGTIAAQAVLKLAGQGKKVLLLGLDRTFQSYSHLLSGYVTTQKYLRGLLECMMYLVLKGTGCEINVDKVCKELDAFGINLALLTLMEDPIVGTSALVKGKGRAESTQTPEESELFYMVPKEGQSWCKSNPHLASLRNLRSTNFDEDEQKNGHGFFKCAMRKAEENFDCSASPAPAC